MYDHGGIYNSKNDTLTNEAWDAINIDPGSIALSDDYVARTGLPRAQRFPWDSSKGLYYLNGYHGLHCLVCHASLPRIAIPYTTLENLETLFLGPPGWQAFGFPMGSQHALFRDFAGRHTLYG